MNRYGLCQNSPNKESTQTLKWLQINLSIVKPSDDLISFHMALAVHEVTEYNSICNSERLLNLCTKLTEIKTIL